MLHSRLTAPRGLVSVFRLDSDCVAIVNGDVVTAQDDKGMELEHRQYRWCAFGMVRIAIHTIHSNHMHLWWMKDWGCTSDYLRLIFIYFHLFSALHLKCLSVPPGECHHGARRHWPLLFSAGLRPPAPWLNSGKAACKYVAGFVIRFLYSSINTASYEIGRFALVRVT